MKVKIYNHLFLLNRCLLVFIICLVLSTGSYADEIYTPGIYNNTATGDQYIVSGATSHSGRTLWTVSSTGNTSWYFSGIWETGTAIGNSVIAGTSKIVTYPDGYGPGRSYGIIGENNISGWYEGYFLAASGNGSEITISSINSDGSIRYFFTLTLMTEGESEFVSSEDFSPGVYRSPDGYGYLVSGAPSYDGRTVWAVVALPDNPYYFCATWETGPAIGNSLLAGGSNISDYPYGYAAGRSYGIIGENNISGWYEGYFLAAVQAENTIYLSEISSGGVTDDQFTLIKENTVPGSLGASSDVFIDGYYRSQSGTRYLVSGSREKTGRTIWTIVSVNMPTIFNATWETGPAIGNSLLAGGSNISDYPYGYEAGRSYGVIGENNISGWYEGYFLAAVQAENTIYLSEISSRGFTDDQIALVRESSGLGGSTGSNTEVFLAGTDYEDVNGNTYTVSQSGDIWSITGTNGTSFNAMWQTGTADGNTLLAGSNCISNYPDGYLQGRSYGIIDTNDFSGWYDGDFIAAIQAGNTISLSEITCSGFMDDQFIITKGGTGGTGGSGKMAFRADLYYVNKNIGEAYIAVSRTDGGSGMTSVMYSTSDGTATSYDDYIPVNGGMLSWSDGDTASKIITIEIPDTASANEYFSLTLMTPVGGTVLGSQVTTTVQIFDDISQITYPNYNSIDPLDINDPDDYLVLTGSSTKILTSNSVTHVYGTYDANNIILESGAGAKLFNMPGNNSISLKTNSSLFSVYKSGTMVTFEGSDGTMLVMPATATVQYIIFSDQTLSLQIRSGSVMLGNQVVEITETEIQ